MNAREFHALAARLATRPAAPAECRSAISRAYYAAFHIGSETLTTMGFSPGRGGGAHGEVARSFHNAADVAIAAAGRTLADLHTLRIRADYHLGRTDVEQLTAARRSVDDAKVVIDTFDQLLRAPELPMVRQSIAAWRKVNGYP